MSMQTEAAGIPAYTPVVTGSVKQYVYKRKGCLVDRQIRLLAEAPRNEAWACRVERLAAALVLLPDSVTRFCTRTDTLEQLEEEVPGVHANAREALAKEAAALSDRVSRD